MIKIKTMELWAIVGKEQREEIRIQIKVKEDITKNELLKMVENFAKIVEYGYTDLEEDKDFSITIENEN